MLWLIYVYILFNCINFYTASPSYAVPTLTNARNTLMTSPNNRSITFDISNSNFSKFNISHTIPFKKLSIPYPIVDKTFLILHYLHLLPSNYLPDLQAVPSYARPVLDFPRRIVCSVPVGLDNILLVQPVAFQKQHHQAIL